MNQNIIPFDYDSRLIRVVTDEDGNPWWVAKDVCNVLDIQNPRQAVQGLDDDEKGVSKVYTPGGEQNAVTVNEPGLYTLIIRSNKPGAKAFKRWITHEVLPSIRKTGEYRHQAGAGYLGGGPGRGRGISRMVSRKRFGSVLAESFTRIKRGNIFYIGFRLKPVTDNH